MRGYNSRDVARLLGLTVAQVRAFARDGFLTPPPPPPPPGRGARRKLHVSFQALVILRTAKALVPARLPTRRSRRPLQQLRRDTPRRGPPPAPRAAAADAHVNLGRLLHEQGMIEEAERHYRLALRESPEHATAAFNLGIALEDLNQPADAIEAYRAALATDPRLADAHYNVARLYEKVGKKAAALRHLSIYRRLTVEA